MPNRKMRRSQGETSAVEKNPGRDVSKILDGLHRLRGMERILLPSDTALLSNRLNVRITPEPKETVY